MSQMVTPKEYVATLARRFAKVIYINPDLVETKPHVQAARMIRDAEAYISKQVFDRYFCECKTMGKGCSACQGTHIVPIPIQELRGVVPWPIE